MEWRCQGHSRYEGDHGRSHTTSQTCTTTLSAANSRPSHTCAGALYCIKFKHTLLYYIYAYDIILYCIIMFFILINYIVLYHNVFHIDTLYCIIMFSVLIHRIVLYHNVFRIDTSYCIVSCFPY